MSSLVISIVRTFVPYLIGWLTAQGIAVTDDGAAQISSTLAFAISIGYYVVVRFIERKYPQFGWLLGVPAKPTYKEVK
jgi:hypothetical protein